MFTKNNNGAPQSQPEAARKPQQKVNTNAPSILGRDIVVTGEIKTDGDIQIDGRHEGNIIASRLTIGEQGIVNGTIQAKAVHVRGKITGKVKANVVELAETANVTADITQDRLTIANGAFFDGNCSRLSKTPPAPTTTTTAAKTTAKAKTA